MILEKHIMSYINTLEELKKEGINSLINKLEKSKDNYFIDELEKSKDLTYKSKKSEDDDLSYESEKSEDDAPVYELEKSEDNDLIDELKKFMTEDTVFTKLEKFRKKNTNDVIYVHLYGITISGEYFSIGLEKYITELLKCENIKKLKIYYPNNLYGVPFEKYGYASDLF